MKDKPHQSKPDLDNLIKAVLDAFKVNDQTVYRIVAFKAWSDKGTIVINNI
jgi:Holliday junction resolvase RusA-like endonuclease